MVLIFQVSWIHSPLRKEMKTWLCDCSAPQKEVKVAQSCLTVCDSMDYPMWPHGIRQARILKWIAIPFSRGSLQPRDWTQVFHIEGRFFTSWATREPSKGKADAKTFIKEHREQSKVKLMFTMDVLGWILALSSLWSWWSKTDVKEPWNMTPSPRVQPSLHTSTSDLPVTVPRGFVWILIFLALDACRNKLL